MTDLIKGVDISAYQGDNVNFQALAAAGYKFVVCRCGVGNSAKDKVYDKNIAGARAAVLKVLAYHFIYPLPNIAGQPLRDPKAQAKLHADWSGSDILAACDLEWPDPGAWQKWGCNAQQIVDWTVTYLEEYERLTGVRPIVYTYPFFANAIKLPASFAEKWKLWIASYTTTPTIPHPWTDWVMWQDSGGKTTNLPGGGPVDTDKVRDLSMWEEFENRNVPAPAPEPPPSPPVIPDPPAPTPDPVPAPPPPVPTPVSSNPNIFTLIWQILTGLYNKYVLKK